jgi:adenylate cyclase
MINENANRNILEGTIEFSIDSNEYFGIYKYHPRWDRYIIRAEEKGEFYRDTQIIFYNVAIIIFLLTIICATLGVYLLKRILKFVKIITNAIMEMQRSNKMDLINLDGANPDEITYLGAALNATSSTIDTLMNIFKKFVTKDVALKAYQEKQIRLEGSKNELTILFSDIKSFTFITEALGSDIIQLLNKHYDNTFRPIHDNDGIIGSIIGDALLAVFGTFNSSQNKSLQAIISGFEIQKETENLRKEMLEAKINLEKSGHILTEIEEKVFKAVNLEVGVGIDGGEVFYGNIGSFTRMTNTVIGDNVNSSSRLEGLTRVYKVPIICSEYVKNEVEKITTDYTFVELDKVLVKGKTMGKKIFWPLKTNDIPKNTILEINAFNAAREYYYNGDWVKAKEIFTRLDLPFSSEFLGRINQEKPLNWSGIWSMTTK